MTRMTGVALAAMLLAGCSAQAQDSDGPVDHTERNKQVAREFYEQLWFSDNTDAYADFVADEYVVHDVGDRKNVTEAAIEQKNTADLFHSFGDLSGEIDYQIAEDDMVATRWFISLDASPEAAAMGMTDVDTVSIINVFRFNDEGKIVEIWNHRHDVELPQPGGPPPAEG
ncbi:ester cyclase [Aurantiacibacter poecillastricola]|uniref:ester cyclase n=1 Tax=Aurantiacibacter poecillastricola TaxID=3064385 RepID=UPI00273DC09E|nr:ester cyclase [Aurantiacibacter sp. 219JJ12-13]MDP5261757.1 ester cyclase [Aurantiacibacter sp. 219JJ12-13]